jgi:hypothetical protein
VRIPWSSITRAGTAVLDLSRLTPTMPAALAPHMHRRETLVVAYRAPGGRTRDVSIPLPAGAARDALVAEARVTLGARWAGEEIPYEQIQSRLGTSSTRRTVTVWLFILGVAVFAFLALFVGVTILAVLMNAYLLCVYVFVGGALLFRHGFLEYRNRLAVSGTPTAKASSVAIGLAELFGRARGQTPSPAPISSCPSVYWSIEVRQWRQGAGNKDGSWQTLLKRESAPLETLELEDETGRILVWPHAATLILQEQRWRSQDAMPLPDPGLRLLAEVGRKWPPRSDPDHMSVTEKRLEEGGPLYVMGTLTERAQIPSSPVSKSGAAPRASSRFMQGAPGLADVPALAWALLTSWARTKIDGRAVSPPDVDPHRVLVWRGAQSRPFIIADRPERETLTALSERMWASLLGGAGLMVGALYVVLKMMFHA